MLKECKVLLGLTLTVFLLFFIGCGKGEIFDFSTETPATPATPDTTKPSVTSQTSNGAKVDEPVSASFSEGVYFDSFSLTFESGVNRSGTTSGNGSSTISFSPSKVLNYGTTYTATITNVRDGAGNVLGTVTWSLTTETSDPLTDLTYHATPDSNINDVGSYNSIVLGTDEKIKPGIKTSYITYYNSTDRSLYIISTADGTSFIGPYKIAGPSGLEKVGEYASLVMDDTGRFHVAYYHEGVGLKYATATNIAAWTLETVDNSAAIVGKYTSITLDSTGKVHISYYDQTNTALKYATNVSGAWLSYTVDTGLPGENPGLYSSIKVDKLGTVHISYYDSVIGDIKYYNPTSTPQILVPDSTGQLGEFSSLYVDDSSNVYIIYNIVSAADGKRRIRVITDASGDWQHAVPDITEVSSLTSNPIFVDADGIFHLSYYSDGVLYYRRGILDENFTWDWSVENEVDSSGIGNGIYTSIVADSNGKPRIAYYDLTEGDLKFAY